MNAVTSLVRRSPLVSFFVLTYALSWGIGALFAGVPLIAPDRLFGAGPLVAALLVAALAEGRAGLRDLGRRLVRWRVGLGWYAVVLVLPLVIVGVTVALIPVFGGTALDWTQRPDLAPTALMLVALLVLPLATPLGEEIGWRGFALPRLLAVRSPLTATLILSVIWGLWHLPVVLDKPELRVPAPFFLQVIPLAVLFTWLFLRTGGSVLIAVVFHAWYDLVLDYVLEPIARSDFARMWWLLFAVQSIVAVIVLLVERRRFTQKTTDPAVRRPAAVASG
jgi:membrane protease YdiL (CAAX protease family)